MTTRQRQQPDAWEIWAKRARDALLFGLGLIGGFDQLFLSKPDTIRLSLIALLLGLPFTLRQDERRDRR